MDQQAPADQPELVTIRAIQGDGLGSVYAGDRVSTIGLVTGVLKRGFFIQTPNVVWDKRSSDGVFVYSPDWQATAQTMLQVTGEVLDYVQDDNAKPVTQIHFEDAKLLKSRDADDKPYSVEPIEFTQAFLPDENYQIADLLNSLEGMLISIDAGQTFISPSNPYGDYVLALDAQGTDKSVLRSEQQGAIAGADNDLRWFPGFRITNYNHAPRINVGSKLLSKVTGPLNYRVDSYQVSVTEPIKVEPSFISLDKSALEPSPGSVTVMTLNCFNLDPHVESEALVLNPRQDVDDDWGEGRFHTLGQAVVLQANSPDIVALQEIQDNDGAEITDVVDASETYRLLCSTIEELSGIQYGWVDVNPEVGMDGGQPGGNIRNGYLYNPNRVKVLEDTVRVFGKEDACFEDSRKPLIVHFEELDSGKQIALINLHLASKRHQNSIFAPLDPGVDAKLSVRVAQAKRVEKELLELAQEGTPYYVTGDFNDTEHSQTLAAMIGDHSANLVDKLPPEERYDYNHRGKLQVLMHGIVNKQMIAKDTERAQYEIIHGNELIGIKPGEESDKPSDHAYVIAKLRLD